MRRRIAAEIAHQLHARLDDIGHVAEVAGVNDAVVALVRLGEVREPARSRPVELAAVHNHAAALYGMTVHVFCGGMDDNIRAPLKRTAQDRGRESIVDDERHTVLVRDVRPLFDIEHGQRWVGERFAEYGLGVGLEQLLDLFLVRLCVRPDAFDTQLFERHAEQVDRAAVDGGGRDKAVARRAQVEDGDHGSCLARAGQHRADAALQLCNLLFNRVAGRVGETGVHELSRHVEQAGDVRGRVKAVGGGLHDRQRARAAVFRLVACMQAAGFDFHYKNSFARKWLTRDYFTTRGIAGQGKYSHFLSGI